MNAAEGGGLYRGVLGLCIDTVHQRAGALDPCVRIFHVPLAIVGLGALDANIKKQNSRTPRVRLCASLRDKVCAVSYLDMRSSLGVHMCMRPCILCPSSAR